MFACPTRRALLSCNSHALPTSRRLISTATATSIQQRPSRRYSSSSSSSSNSKPFGPNSRGLASKTGAFRKRERQCENGQQQQTAQSIAPPIPGEVEIKPEQAPKEAPKVEQNPLPFVARTDHLRAKDIHASAFFALHRPMSVRFPVPGIYNASSFQKLFDPSTALSNMELHKIQQEVQARQPTINENDSVNEQDTILSPDEVRAYGRNSAQMEQKASTLEPQVKISSPILFEQYLPFNPPPPPEPISEEAIKAERASFEKLKGMQIITSTEGSADGQPYILAFFQGPENQTNRVGRIRKTMRSEVPTMQALSVKRQRKLKMKKHKYKKLMKKTRTLRRRLEKQ
ncbi:hypothetical protein TWF718_008572 [Orbilia javanica]|uniref:Small ribosomal subunit protein mS38 n=1 Tax=Orbilia javanica TaxID=47235 RepID=A0AAN8ML20_9PEZI